MITDIQRETFFSQLTENEILIVRKLQSIVKKFPSLEERISYSVLYYFQNSRVCFIWPASIKPGPKSGVQFGFCEGYLLEDRAGILEKGNRKQVYCITYHKIEEIKEEHIVKFIENSLAIDSTLYKAKKRKN